MRAFHYALAASGLAPRLEVSLNSALEGTRYADVDGDLEVGCALCVCHGDEERSVVDGVATGHVGRHLAFVARSRAPWAPSTAETFGFEETSAAAALDSKIEGALAVLKASSTTSRCCPGAAAAFVAAVGDDGLHRLLGLRTTPRTLAGRLPPRRSHLIAAALVSKPPVKVGGKETLSAAARAVDKHYHRGPGFFGTSKGTCAAKNAHALGLVNKLLTEAAWANIHALPGQDIAIFEVRVPAGYGARWRCAYEDGAALRPSSCAFRGFLEPQMADGHDRGWRH